MSRAAFIVASGLSVRQTHAVLGNISSAVSAAGTTQGTATQLTADVNLVTTATEGQGVILPAMTLGDVIWVANGTSGGSAADFYVYPVSGGKLNGQTVDVGLLLPPAKAAVFVALNSLDCLVHY